MIYDFLNYELSCHAAGGIATHEFFNFINGYLVVVAINGMFKTGSSNGKV